MLGFIIGVGCAVGLMRLAHRRGYWAGRFGCGSHAGGPMGYGGGMGRESGARRWFLRWIFERLETTPGQERAIVSALDELRENRGAAREELEQTRADVARVLGSGLVDDAALEETFARQDRTLARMRVSFVEALKKVAETLDERQRKELARMIERRGGFGGGPRWGGPFGRVWA